MPRVGDIYRLVTLQTKTVNENAFKNEVIKAMLTGPPTVRSVYVVDEDGHLKGIITLNHILKGIAVQQGLATGNIDLKSPFKLFRYTPFGKARDMMRSPVHVTRNTKLQEALEKMIQQHMNELPVVDEEGKVIGDLNAFELLKFV
jgi:CBS domain-containing protein